MGVKRAATSPGNGFFPCISPANRGKRDDGLPHGVLALPPRCDREVRCETGAAPATVSGESAATATGSGLGPTGKAPRATTPSQETSASPLLGRFLGRRRD